MQSLNKLERFYIYTYLVVNWNRGYFNENHAGDLIESGRGIALNPAVDSITAGERHTELREYARKLATNPPKVKYDHNG